MLEFQLFTVFQIGLLALAVGAILREFGNASDRTRF
jgi:hypothetical protein